MTGPDRCASDHRTHPRRSPSPGGGGGGLSGVLRRVLTVVGIVAVALLGTALPASAHAVLERSDPVGGAALDQAPARVTLTFSEAVSVKSDAIRVLDATGARADDGEAKNGSSASEVTIALRSGLGTGTYVVSWRVVSADSHPVGGAFAFGIGGPPDAGAAAALPSGGGGSRAVGVALGAARLVTFAGAALLIGATFFLTVLWPAGARRRGPVRLIAAGWLLSLFGAIGMLLLQGPYSSGEGITSVLDADQIAVTLEDRYGQLLAIRMLALLLAVPLLRRVRQPAGEGGGEGGGAGHQPTGPGRRGLVELAGLGLVLATTMAMIGHASAGGLVWLATASMTLHTTAMAIWLGGLCVLGLSLLGRPRPRHTGTGTGGAEGSPRGPGSFASPADPAAVSSGRGTGAVAGTSASAEAVSAAGSMELPGLNKLYGLDGLGDGEPVEAGWADEMARVLPRWSRTAMVAVAVIVLTGIFQTLREIGAFGALFGTTYGRLLLYKLWFVLGALGLGLLAQRWVHRHFPAGSEQPASEQPPSSQAAPNQTAPNQAVTSLAIAGLRRGVIFEMIVGVAVLTVTAILVNTIPGRESYAPPFSRTAIAGPMTVDVEIAPTRTGLETIRIHTYDPQGRPQRLVEAKGELSLPAAGVGPLDVPLVRVADGQAVAEGVGVPLPGQWQLRLYLRVNDFDQYVTTVFYRVR
ncbi:copper transport protein [Parafrankia irregularis]|uniref:Copper transport protein n=1 Tax=Parafrankia irregularis TaxID=795642 RepID=A0A0S4QNK6_9ACTN|nr:MULTISPECIES: copper resistance protein CopC [Parafrankia]MBE3204247.1 copper resistance protein CopC/CopD [Parafrankia sp. CH37]CUU57217.1 copper transport protein [Parafrankia irregularis]